MDRAILARRAFHLASPAWLVWYWMPPDAWLGVRKEGVLVLFFACALAIEAARLLTAYRIPGLRAYESDRLSAFAWGGLGLAVALAFFPGEYVIPTFWGMAWIDPLCGYSRQKGGYPWLPTAAYGTLAAILFMAVVPLAPYQTTPVPLGLIALYAPLAAVVAIAAERPNLRYVDDDFVMHIVPLLALTAASRIL